MLGTGWWDIKTEQKQKKNYLELLSLIIFTSFFLHTVLISIREFKDFMGLVGWFPFPPILVWNPWSTTYESDILLTGPLGSLSRTHPYIDEIAEF